MLVLGGLSHPAPPPVICPTHPPRRLAATRGGGAVSRISRWVGEVVGDKATPLSDAAFGVVEGAAVGVDGRHRLGAVGP